MTHRIAPAIASPHAQPHFARSASAAAALAVLGSFALSSAAQAAPGADSPYVTDAQSSHVEDATSRGISQVNMITCIMSAMKPDALVNQGDYGALVDMKQCDPNARSDSGNAASNGAGAGAASYMKATVNSSRASNTEPMRVKTWLELVQSDFSALIYLNIQATEAPSESNPYGVFRLDYCGTAGSSACMMNGYLQGGTDGIRYFEIEGQGGDAQTRALRLTSASTDSGAGGLHYQEQGQTWDYQFAYNADLFRRGNGSEDQCFSRDASDPDTAMSVWRYGLYDANSGARVERHSGFPIEFTGNDASVYQGHMGYWGLWTPADAPPLLNGAEVRRVEYHEGQDPSKTSYTLVKAEGRLMKYSKQTRALASIDKLPFTAMVWRADGFIEGAALNQQYEFYWDDAAGDFKATGVQDCSNNNRCETRSFDTPTAVSASYFAQQGGVRGWSQSLGGELFVALEGGGTVDSSTVQVVYRTQDLVYPADMPADLFCLRDCPTAATLSAYFAEASTNPSPFVEGSYNTWGPSSTLVSYHANASTALLMDATAHPLVQSDSAALARRPQYQGGVRTGRLITNAADAVCDGDETHYCDAKIEQLATFYQWETGPSSWNQFAALKDQAGQFVQFDAPLPVNFAVPSGSRYGSYAGKSMVLQYGGFGELWGIPGQCVLPATNAAVSCDTPNARYVPAFAIPQDESTGVVTSNGTTYLVKWLDREIRFAHKDLSTCSSAGLNLPSGLSLPTADELANPADPGSAIYIGAKPEITAAPRVIQGEVKY